MGQLLPCQSVLVEGIVDGSCYLFLLGPGDLVLSVFRTRSYAVRDLLAVRVLPGLESGHVGGQVLGGEEVKCAAHSPSLDQGTMFPESILDIMDCDVVHAGPY